MNMLTRAREHHPLACSYNDAGEQSSWGGALHQVVIASARAYALPRP
jgi:hypothetical protein